MQRDAQALAEAGVPIVSVRGPAGGYRLERGYRTKLTGLDAAEAEALFVGPAAELGLGRELAAARLKLIASLPADLQERAGRAARLFHVDTRGWFREEDRVPHLSGDRRSVVARPPARHALPGGRGRRLAAPRPARAHPQGRCLVPARAAPRRGACLPRIADRLGHGSATSRATGRKASTSRLRGLVVPRRSSGAERGSRSRFASPAARSDTSARRAIVEDGERPTVIAQFDGLDHAFHALLAYGAAGGGARSARAARANRGRGSRDRRPLYGCGAETAIVTGDDANPMARSPCSSATWRARHGCSRRSGRNAPAGVGTAGWIPAYS